MDALDDWRGALNQKYSQPEYQKILNNTNTTNNAAPAANTTVKRVSSGGVGGGGSTNTSQGILLSRERIDSFNKSIDHKQLEEDIPLRLSNNPYIDEYRKKLQILQTYEAIRFPPVIQTPILTNINKLDYKLSEALQNQALQLIQNNPEYSTIQTSESYAGIQFLENMLLTFVDKLDEIRSLIIEHTTYLYSLSRPPELEEDSEYIKTIIINNLTTLKNDLQQLIEDMIIFQPYKIDEMIHNDSATTSHDTSREIFIRTSLEGKLHPIQLLKQSLISRGMKLNDEITISILNVEQLKQYSLSLIHYPSFSVTPFAGFHTYWNDHIRLQYKQKMSYLSLGLKAFMLARDCKVNNMLFQYLQSPEDYGNMLVFNQYTFTGAEFAMIIQFLLHEYRLTIHLKKQKEEKELYNNGENNDFRDEEDEEDEFGEAITNKINKKDHAHQHSTVMSKIMDLNPFSDVFGRPFNNGTVAHSIQTLVLFNCNLNDSDCYQLSLVLPKLINLQFFDLSYNRITYSGISSIIMVMFEYKLYIKQWILDYNRLSSDAAILLGQVLDYLPRLEIFSISGNPIKDQGCYSILQGCLNKDRKIYKNLPPLDKTPNTSSNNNNNSTTVTTPKSRNYSGYEEEEDDYIEEEEEEEILLESEEEIEEVTYDKHDNSNNNNKLKKRYPKNCYYQDYYSGYLSREMLRQHQINQIRESKRHHYQWVNYEEEEFMMDIPSEYSFHEDDDDDDYSVVENDETGESYIENGTSDEYGEKKQQQNHHHHRHHRHLTYQERLQQNETLALSKIHEELTLEEYISHYPKLVQKLLKLRIKLIAIIVFKQLLKKGHRNLYSLSFSNCQLTNAIIPMISLTYIQNNQLNELNISKNKTLLSNDYSCKLIANMISNSVDHYRYNADSNGSSGSTIGGKVKSLDISDTDLHDSGLAIISQAILRSNDLEYFNISNNHIGPTGASIVANLCKEFGVESLTVSSGTVRPAPFPMKNYPWSDVEFDKGRLGRKSVATTSALTRSEDEVDDDESFVDTDLFDGDEEEEGNDEETFDEKESSANRGSGAGGASRRKSRKGSMKPRKASPKKTTFGNFIPHLFRTRDENDSMASKVEML